MCRGRDHPGDAGPDDAVRHGLTRALRPSGNAGRARAKGFEAGTRRLLADVLAEALPAAVPAALSGPSFAADVARGLPTAVTIAAVDGALADRLAAALASPSFRPYASDDLVGVEIAAP